MAIPKFDEFFVPILTLLSDNNAHTTREIYDYCAESFKLTEDDRNFPMPSGGNMLMTRVSWAKSYLKVAGLLESPKRATFVITEAGKNVLKEGKPLTQKYVRSLWKDDKDSAKPDSGSSMPPIESPLESIENAISELNSVLIDDLLTKVRNMNPYDFEKLVVDLLVKMGYGEGFVTQVSKDGGIDGIVKADRFGFDIICTQAKKWKEDSSVGSPTIHEFSGAMAGQKATKGLFITTGNFSKGAKDYAANLPNQKIILIDGKQLAELMIEYDLGVTTVKTYPIKRIDSDYFDADN